MNEWPWWINYARGGILLFVIVAGFLYPRMRARRRALEEELRFKRQFRQRE